MDSEGEKSLKKRVKHECHMENLQLLTIGNKTSLPLFARMVSTDALWGA